MGNPGQEAFRKAANEVIGHRKEYSQTLRIEDGVAIEEGALTHKIPLDEITAVSPFGWGLRFGGINLWCAGVVIKTSGGATYSPQVDSQKAQEFIQDIDAVRERVRSLSEAREPAETQLRQKTLHEVRR